MPCGRNHSPRLVKWWRTEGVAGDSTPRVLEKTWSTSGCYQESEGRAMSKKKSFQKRLY